MTDVVDPLLLEQLATPMALTVDAAARTAIAEPLMAIAWCLTAARVDARLLHRQLSVLLLRLLLLRLLPAPTVAAGPVSEVQPAILMVHLADAARPTVTVAQRLTTASSQTDARMDARDLRLRFQSQPPLRLHHHQLPPASQSLASHLQ